jgi:hypothetical protein
MAVLSTPSLLLPGASPPHSITPVPAPGPAATSSAGLPHRPALPTLPPTAPVSPISPSAGGRSKAQRWHDGSPSPCTSYPRTYKDALVSPAAAIQAPPPPDQAPLPPPVHCIDDGSSGWMTVVGWRSRHRRSQKTCGGSASTAFPLPIALLHAGVACAASVALRRGTVPTCARAGRQSSSR